VAGLSAENGSSGSNGSNSSHQSTKLVTFLGKGGSGKTTSAVFAAQVHGYVLRFIFDDNLWVLELKVHCFTSHIIWLCEM